MGDDSQNQYGGRYAGSSLYGAVASSQSPEQVAKESRLTRRSKHDE